MEDKLQKNRCFRDRMIQKNKIKKLANTKGKKLSREAILEINKIIKRETENILEKAERKASFAGRKIILKKDLE